MTWMVDVLGERVGPMPYADVVEGLASGRFGPSCLVWTEGMAAWLPIQECFPNAEGMPAGAQADLPAGDPAESPGWRRYLYAAISIALLIVLGSASLLFPLSEPARVVAIAAGTGVALLGGALALAVRPARASSARPLRRRALIALSLIGAMASLGVGIPLYHLSVARQAMGDVKMGVAGDGRVLVLSGPIGIDSPQRLERALEHAPATRIIALDSGGGLLNRALAIREIVQGRHLDTMLLGQCDSACIPILFAGENRYASIDGKLIAHEVEALDTAPAWMRSLRPYGVASYLETLRAEHVPEEIVEATSRGEVASFTADTLIDRGILQPMDERYHVLSPPDLQWARAARKLRRSRSGDQEAIGYLLDLLRESRLDLREPLVQAVIEAAAQPEALIDSSAVHELLVRVVRDAVVSADPEPTGAFFSFWIDRAQAASNAANWAQCERLAGAMEVPLAELGAEDRLEAIYLVAEMARTAGDGEWSDVRLSPARFLVQPPLLPGTRPPSPSEACAGAIDRLRNAAIAPKTE